MALVTSSVSPQAPKQPSDHAQTLKQLWAKIIHRSSGYFCQPFGHSDEKKTQYCQHGVAKSKGGITEGRAPDSSLLSLLTFRKSKSSLVRNRERKRSINKGGFNIVKRSHEARMWGGPSDAHCTCNRSRKSCCIRSSQNKSGFSRSRWHTTSQLWLADSVVSKSHTASLMPARPFMLFTYMSRLLIPFLISSLHL